MPKRTLCMLFSPLALSTFLFLPGAALADEVVTLKNGAVLEGRIAAWSASQTDIYFVTNEQGAEPRWISLTEVDSIKFDGVPTKWRNSHE